MRGRRTRLDGGVSTFDRKNVIGQNTPVGRASAPRPPMALRFPPIPIRLVAGVLAGACAWPAVSASLWLLPLPARFLVTWLLFTFGPGMAVAGRLTRDLDPLRRLIVVLGAGSAAAPVLIDVLGRLNLVPAFPYIVAAFTGGGLALWRDRSSSQPARVSWADATGVCRPRCAGSGARVRRVLASVGYQFGQRCPLRRLRLRGPGLLRG